MVWKELHAEPSFRLNWIGRIADATRVLLMSSKVNARSIPELRGREVIIGSTGRVSETYLMPMFMNKVLGTKFKIVLGYQAAGKMNRSAAYIAGLLTASDVGPGPFTSKGFAARS